MCGHSIAFAKCSHIYLNIYIYIYIYIYKLYVYVNIKFLAADYMLMPIYFIIWFNINKNTRYLLGNLESDLQAGAQTGYQLGWVVWWSTIIGLILQVYGSIYFACIYNRLYMFWFVCLCAVAMRLCVIISSNMIMVGFI